MHRTFRPFIVCCFVASLLLTCSTWTGCGSSEPVADGNPAEGPESYDPPVESEADPATEAANSPTEPEVAVATFGSGCFWCTEAIFERMEGVQQAVSGYMGGAVENPTYKMVCSGRTGHAEVVQVTYDPNVVAFEELLQAFWKTHDPTTLNRQGHDIGTQYRSVVFYHTDEQRQSAEHYKKRLDDAEAFPDPIVTEITAASKFYPAEQGHQDYFALNPNEGYCEFVIAPKVEKFEQAFGEKLKASSK